MKFRIWFRQTCLDLAEAVIEFNAGARSSLQYHVYKHEHIYVDQGRLGMELEQEAGVGQGRSSSEALASIIVSPPA